VQQVEGGPLSARSFDSQRSSRSQHTPKKTDRTLFDQNLTLRKKRNSRHKLCLRSSDAKP
jgi:hypothetical protein